MATSENQSELDAGVAERVLSVPASLSAWRALHAAALGQPCANCACVIEGPYCLACGQGAESFERSIGPLLVEAFESLLHADGRLLGTLRRLVLSPATLTRDYVGGKRASQTPPLRMFLVFMVIVFFTGNISQAVHPGPPLFVRDHPAEAVTLTPGPGLVSRSAAGWINPRLTYAANHQAEFAAVLESELHSTAIVFLPLSALLLGALFAFDRRFFVFDHAIFSMHSLSFMGLLFSVLSMLSLVGPLAPLERVFLLAAPAHLFFHLRGVYSTSVVGTLLRMGLLFIGSAVGVAVLLLVDVGLGLNSFEPTLG